MSNPNNNEHGFPWRFYFYELVCTALLLVIGLSIVTLMFAEGSPIPKLIPDIGVRRLITGFLFGGTGALIAISHLGKVSGAHLNPVVTMTFFLFGKVDKRTAVAYVLGQFSGAIIGCLPILLWGSWGRSVNFGATIPGEGYSTNTAFYGELITTLTMISLLVTFLAIRSLRPYTPAIFPPLYSIMSFLEAGISGTSTNPARTLGPAIISGRWDSWWIYWVAPFVGGILACIILSALAKRIGAAKLYHFDSDEDKLLRRKGAQLV